MAPSTAAAFTDSLLDVLSPPLPQADNDTAHTAIRRKLRRFDFITQSLFSVPANPEVDRKNTQKNRLKQQSIRLVWAATLPIRL
jgi:hypothetical protein